MGVFVDDRRERILACVGDRKPRSVAPATSLAALRVIDEVTPMLLASYTLPGPRPSLCNDIAVGRDGSIFVTETLGGRILHLGPNGRELEPWLEDARLNSIDGIAVDGNALYVTTYLMGRAFRITIGPNGRPAAIVELSRARALDHPDGLRAIGRGRFLLAEAGANGGIGLAAVSGETLIVRRLTGGRPGTASAVALDGRVWAVVPRRAVRDDPSRDPGIDAIYSSSFN